MRWSMGAVAAWLALLAGGCTCTQSTGAEGPASVSAAQLAASERQRVGALARLHATGAVEIRSKDESGSHFDQGDLDLRWNPSLGLAASAGKFGDRFAWLGADRSSWWIFDLKSKPTTLRTGPLASPNAAMVAVLPWLMGLHPLAPADDAQVSASGGRIRVQVAVPDRGLPKGATLSAEFDAKTLAPRRTLLTLGNGGTISAELDDIGSVETLGVGQGAWPHIPKRIQLAASSIDTLQSLTFFIGGARSDAEGVDRPQLYDLANLRERFQPQKVEEEQ